MSSATNQKFPYIFYEKSTNPHTICTRKHFSNFERTKIKTVPLHLLFIPRTINKNNSHQTCGVSHNRTNWPKTFQMDTFFSFVQQTTDLRPRFWTTETKITNCNSQLLRKLIVVLREVRVKKRSMRKYNWQAHGAVRCIQNTIDENYCNWQYGILSFHGENWLLWIKRVCKHIERDYNLWMNRNVFVLIPIFILTC